MIIFFGENGSNAMNLLYLNFPIKAAFTNKKNSKLIPILKALKIPVFIIDSFEGLKEKLETIDHKLIISMGFLKIFPKEITDNFNIINMHPSILPEYKGLNAFELSYKNKKAMGITYHWVNEKLDSGEIIEQIKLNYNNCKNIETAKLLLKYNEYKYTPIIIYREYRKILKRENSCN